MVQGVIRRLERSRFVAITGSSGAGKSSLVRAGVMPALFSGIATRASWRIAVMRPGSVPRQSLARALGAAEGFGSAREDELAETLRYSSLGLIQAVRDANLPAGTRLLLIVDQFEEVFRYGMSGDGDEFAAFVKLLLEAASTPDVLVSVLITLRTDYLAECERFWGLPEAISDNLVLVSRMTRDELRHIIEGPTNLAGAGIEPRLVDRLLNDAGEQREPLGLLQHALRRTWDYWGSSSDYSGPLGLTHYVSVGGLGRSLELELENILGNLDDRARAIAMTVFQRLVEQDAAGRLTRRPTRLSELVDVAGAPSEDVIAVLDVFRDPARSFLLPGGIALNDDVIIDIAHEGIIRHWPRLRRWIGEERSSAELYSRLAEVAVLHREGKAGYYRDPELTLALQWRARTHLTAGWARRYHPDFEAAMRFLDASLKQRDLENRSMLRRHNVERVTLYGTLLLFGILIAYLLIVRR
jgi:hypothetical protein